MKLTYFVEILSMCGASILIGTLATIYLIGASFINLLCSRGGATLVFTILSALAIYGSSLLFFLAKAENFIMLLPNQLPIFFDELFSSDQINPFHLPNFSELFDALGIFIICFLAIGAFYTLFFYLKKIIEDLLGDIRLFIQLMCYRNKNGHQSSFCCICLD